MDAATQAVRTLAAELRGDAERTAERLRRAARDAGYWMSADDRIGEADLATLLGLSAGTLANRRSEGTAPPAYKLGGRGHRISYRLSEVGAWIEAHRHT